MCIGLACMLMQGWTMAAQEKAHVVKGKILDEENLPLVGVGVVVVGTLNGVISDENGNYSISALPEQELQFSFLGFKTETIKVGSQTVINLTMKSDAEIMESAVVTALGIKSDEKSIGYSAQKVGSENFASSATTGNWLNGMSGQVAGLNIDRSSGPDGSMRVTVRGESSANLDTNPLPGRTAKREWFRLFLPGSGDPGYLRQ